MERPEVITQKNLENFGEKYGYEIQREVIDPNDSSDVTTGDRKIYFNFYSWMKNTCTPLTDYSRYPNIADLKDGQKFKQFYIEYEDFKNEIGKIDCSDMLTECYSRGLLPDTKVLIVDEFQDLTLQQYKLFNAWAESMDDVIIAGDPLQAIYPFWGGNPDYLRTWDAEQRILPISYRLSANVWRAAGDTLRYKWKAGNARN